MPDKNYGRCGQNKRCTRCWRNRINHAVKGKKKFRGDTSIKGKKQEFGGEYRKYDGNTVLYDKNGNFVKYIEGNESKKF